MSGGVEDAIDAELEGVAGLGRPDTIDEALACAGDGSGEVAAAGIVGEILAPGAALRDGFLLEEEFRRGGELVEVLDGDLEIVIGVVEAAAFFGGVCSVCC